MVIFIFFFECLNNLFKINFQKDMYFQKDKNGDTYFLYCS
jgi:hypothetical protein